MKKILFNVFIVFFAVAAELASQAELHYSSSLYLPQSAPELQTFAEAYVSVQQPLYSSQLQTQEQLVSSSNLDFHPKSTSVQQSVQFPGQYSYSSVRIFGARNSVSPVSFIEGSRSSPSNGEYSNSDQSLPVSQLYRSPDNQYSLIYSYPPVQFGVVSHTEYAPTQQQSFPPSQENFPPPTQEDDFPVTATTTEQPSTTTEVLATSTEVTDTTTESSERALVGTSTEQTNATATEDEHSEKLTQSEQQGIYYVYHPSGQLQRIRYTAYDDPKGMEYSAKLKYENVEPVSGPIYTYDPETYVFRRIN